MVVVLESGGGGVVERRVVLESGGGGVVERSDVVGEWWWSGCGWWEWVRGK